MLYLILWSLLLSGVVNGVSKGSLFSPLWDWFLNRDWWLLRKVGELFSCPMCLGFWVAGLLSYYVLGGPFLAEAAVAAEYSRYHLKILNPLVADMFFGSAVSWILHRMCKQ